MSARKKGAPSGQLKKKIRDHTAQVVVIGQGYVGLPLAREIADAGMQATGYDLNKAVTSAELLDVAMETLVRGLIRGPEAARHRGRA